MPDRSYKKEQLQDEDIGEILGDLSDDLKGDYFVSAVFGGKKLYVLRKKSGGLKIAAKGIPIEEDTDSVINEETLLGLHRGQNVEACRKETFRRNKNDWTIKTETLSRTIACTYTGRVIGRDFRTYPMGYQNIPFPEDNSPEQELVQHLKKRINDENLMTEYFDDLVESENVLIE